MKVCGIELAGSDARLIVLDVAKNQFQLIPSSSGQDFSVFSAKYAFKLFDFFANCEYFEKKSNYNEVIKLPKEETGYKLEAIPPKPPYVR